MAASIYVLCALTSIACAVMLFRGYHRSRARLLLWSSLCFVCLAINNILLFIDKVVVPGEEFLVWQRSSVALAGLVLLIYGLVWESE